MDSSERLLERSERALELERDRAVARIKEELSLPGTLDCDDCGEPVEAKRRIALPSARTCIRCQIRREARSRR